MKILALDIGDQWTGIAISDATGILARPYATVATTDLVKELTALLPAQRITTVVVGLPLTLKGTHSDQTNKVLAMKDRLATALPQITWATWDERLTSKQVDSLRHARTKEEKLQSHARAAALILQTYLDHRSISAPKPTDPEF